MSRFAPDQMFRIIIGPLSFTSSLAEIDEGVFDYPTPSSAVQMALAALEKSEPCAVGLAGNWLGFNVQIDKV